MKNTIEQVLTVYTFAVMYNGKEYEVQTDEQGAVIEIWAAIPSATSKDNWPELHTEIKNWVEDSIQNDEVKYYGI